MWPSNYTDYSVKRALHFRGGKGDVLREFADAANRWGIDICYYLNVRAALIVSWARFPCIGCGLTFHPLCTPSHSLQVQNNGYLALVEKVNGSEFIEREVNMIREVLANYGLVEY